MKYICNFSFSSFYSSISFRKGEIISEYVYNDLDEVDQEHFSPYEQDDSVSSDNTLDVLSTAVSLFDSTQDDTSLVDKDIDFGGFDGGSSGGAGASDSW